MYIQMYAQVVKGLTVVARKVDTILLLLTHEVDKAIMTII